MTQLATLVMIRHGEKPCTDGQPMAWASMSMAILIRTGSPQKDGHGRARSSRFSPQTAQP